MADSFIHLSAKDRADALGTVATSLGRPAALLEKDVWVVWVLDALFSAPFGEHLRFKGGTSLSKAYKAIRRFSEDLDITYDIRALLPDHVGAAREPFPGTRSQERKWTSVARKRLSKWIEDTALPHIQTHIEANRAPARALIEEGHRLYVSYEPASASSTNYVKPAVLIEFGARSTGEPAREFEVVCDAAEHLPTLVFPTASPLVMAAERTFWEKATAIHVYCLGGQLGGERFARHWYDLVRLDDVGIADRALSDRDLALRVAQHKTWFFPVKDAARRVIDYQAAVLGSLRLVPDGAARSALNDDYDLMVEAGLFEEQPIDFGSLMERSAALERRANETA